MAKGRGVWRFGLHVSIAVVSRRERAAWITTFGLSVFQEVAQGSTPASATSAYVSRYHFGSKYSLSAKSSASDTRPVLANLRWRARIGKNRLNLNVCRSIRVTYLLSRKAEGISGVPDAASCLAPELSLMETNSYGLFAQNRNNIPDLLLPFIDYYTNLRRLVVQFRPILPQSHTPVSGSRAGPWDVATHVFHEL